MFNGKSKKLKNVQNQLWWLKIDSEAPKRIFKHTISP